MTVIQFVLLMAILRRAGGLPLLPPSPWGWFRNRGRRHYYRGLVGISGFRCGRPTGLDIMRGAGAFAGRYKVGCWLVALAGSQRLCRETLREFCSDVNQIVTAENLLTANETTTTRRWRSTFTYTHLMCSSWTKDGWCCITETLWNILLPFLSGLAVEQEEEKGVMRSKEWTMDVEEEWHGHRESHVYGVQVQIVISNSSWHVCLSVQDLMTKVGDDNNQWAGRSVVDEQTIWDQMGMGIKCCLENDKDSKKCGFHLLLPYECSCV